MKLVLCSEGFKTPNTVQACVDLVGKPQDQITFAVINEAYAAKAGDKRWVISNLSDVAKNFPSEMDIVNLLAFPIDEIEERISKYDAIFVVGGHTDYLMSVFTKTGFDKLLPKLLENKVYVGSSAGSMIIGKRLTNEAYDLLYENTGYEVSKYLELVDFSIMPHMDSPRHPERMEKLSQAAQKNKGKIYGLNDDSAIVVDGGKIEIIGSEPYEYN